jgi:hypothetical protein
LRCSFFTLSVELSPRCLDERAKARYRFADDQIFAMTDEIAERARKLGGTTLRSISDIAKHQQLKDNNAEFVAPLDMLAELRADNQHLTLPA